jgi:hypothetical protein
MSLLTLPVSIPDLIQLQFGIEFFINANEATTVAAEINADTSSVNSYATGLLANNMSFSQVAMAVSALMEGGTIPAGDGKTSNTLTLLSTVFLPPQVENAVKFGFPPTVYAAEAVGLALSTLPGFQSFVNLDIDQFSQAVSTATGINSGAIKQWVTNWEAFYTAHPQNATTVTQAAYGAAFGDAVGVALANPTVNGTIALLVSEVKNALIDNAEGLYTVGIPLISEPPHQPLQGEALLIGNAGGPPAGPTIDMALFGGNYAQFVDPAQSASLTIKDAPSTFTLDTQHFGTNSIEIDAATAAFGGPGLLCTLILGDTTSGETLGSVVTHGYSTVEIVVANGSGTDQINAGLATLTDGPAPSDLVISGKGGSLDVSSLAAGPIIDNGVGLTIHNGLEVFDKIDASNAPVLVMGVPAINLDSTAGGVTILGGTGPGNLLQGSVSQFGSTVTFTNGTTGLALIAGADHITSNAMGGSDAIFGDGGADVITLPANHSGSDEVVFGEEINGGSNKVLTLNVLATTDGMDVAYPGSWGASTTKTAIPNLFPGAVGGTSADMTTITGFRAGSGGDILGFTVAAWNGSSPEPGSGQIAAQGDLVALAVQSPIVAGDGSLSAVWVNSGSNSSLKLTDNVLRYAPSDALVQNAQQLAAQLHTSFDAVTLPEPTVGFDVHILVAYAAGNNVVNIADVDLVNTTGAQQNSTAKVSVYASDMMSLIGVSLTNLTPDNIHFF